MFVRAFSLVVLVLCAQLANGFASGTGMTGRTGLHGLRAGHRLASAATGPAVAVSSSPPQRERARERVFVALKPDTYERRLVGQLLDRIERKGFRLVGLKMIPKVSREDVERHYAEHREKPFYDDLLRFFLSGPLVASCWEGEDAVAVLRRLCGATSPKDALPGTIRGDFCSVPGRNLVHCSDSAESAQREIDIWFPRGEGLLE